MFKHAEVKEQLGFKAHPMFKQKQGDGAAEKDTYSLDFGLGLSQTHVQTQTVNQGDNSLTLWGPGVQMQENPSSILTQSLHTWRKDHAHLPAAKAAEELEKLYANLPPEALELTFQDMIGRPIGWKEGNGVQNKTSPTNSNRIKEEEVVEVVGQVQNASKEKKGNGSKASKISAKFATLLAMKPWYASNKGELTHAQLNELVEKRRRKSTTSSDREGLYSASTSFRRVSPLTSRNGSRNPSPSASFNMLQIDRDALEREIARSARYLEARLDDSGGPVAEQSPRRQGISSLIGPHMVQKQTTSVPNRNDCSTCPTTNLFFLKTTCQVCGKSFCPSCKTVRTKDIRGVRRCRNSCRAVDKSAGDEWIDDSEEEIMKKVNGCWTIGIGSFIRVKRG